jgi:hypothetical protein
VDEVYLTGKGAEEKGLDPRGYGLALASGSGRHVWCKNEIPGVTAGNSLLGVGRGGRRYEGDNDI